MTTNRVVTELIIDARGAERGSAEYIRRMEAAQRAVDRMNEREQRFNNTSQQTGQALEREAVSVAKAQRQWEAMAASLDPVVAAQQRAERAVRRATLEADAAVRLLGKSQEEAAAMVAAVTAQQNGYVEAARKGAAGSRTVSAANENVAKSAGLARHEMVNLSRQVQDVGVSLASGQSPLTVLIQQGTQVADVFASSNGTVGGFARQIGSMLTPTRAAVGGVTAAVLAGAAAWISYDNAQRDSARSLAGLGRDSGLTVQSLNALAEAQARVTGVPVSRARGTVSALAGSGIRGEMIAPIQAIEKDFAATLGVEAVEANKMLAESFADPVRGAEMLGQRLGGLSLATRRQIEQLVAFGDQQKAQRVLLDAIVPRLGRASELTSFWAREWARVSGASSDALTVLGRFLDKSVNGQAQTSFLEQAQRRLDQLQAANQGQVVDRSNGRLLGMGLNPFGQTQEDLQKQQDGTRRVNGELEIQRAAMHAIQVGQEAITRATERQALAAADVTRNTRLRDNATRTIEQINSPQTQNDRALQEAITRLGTLRAALDRPFETGSIAESANEFQRLQREVRGAEAAVRQLSKNNGAGVLDRRGGLLFDVTSPEGQERLRQQSLAAIQNVNREADARVAAAEARTVREQQRAAQLEADNRRRATMAAGQSPGDPEFLAAEDARRNADIARGASFQLSEAAKERIRSTQASIDAVKAETAVIGGSVAAQEKARAEQQLLADAKREYQRLGLSVPPAEIEAYKRLAEAIGQARQEQALARLGRDATFDRQTMFLSESERRIAQSMQSVWGDGWRQQMGNANAQLLRFNDTLRTTHDLAQDFGRTFVSDLMNSKSATEALGNAVKNLAARLIQMAMDQAIKSLFGGLLSAFGGALGGFGGGSTMTAILANGGVLNGGNLVPFANGGAFTNSIVTRPTVFPMASGAGLMGEAGPEAVMPLKRDGKGRLGVTVSGGGGGAAPVVTYAPTLSIVVEGSANDNLIDTVKTMVAKEREAMRAEIPRLVTQGRRDRLIKAA